MRKKSDALSKAWETINTPLIAADSAMKEKAEKEKKERKSLLLAIKRNSRERQARHITKLMPIKAAQSKENTMSRISGQSKTHTTGSIAREKRATHAHISKLMDDLPKNKPSKGITVTKKTVSMEPVSKVTKVKKPVTLCDLKKKAGINLFLKHREKKAAEKRADLKSKLGDLLNVLRPEKSFSPRNPGWGSNVASSLRNIPEGLRHGFDVTATPKASKMIPGMGGALLGGLGGLAASEDEDEYGDVTYKNPWLKALLGAGAGAGLGVAGASGYVKPKLGPLGQVTTQQMKIGADITFPVQQLGKVAAEKVAFLAWGGGELGLHPKGKGIGGALGYTNLLGMLPIPTGGIDIGGKKKGFQMGVTPDRESEYGLSPYVGLRWNHPRRSGLTRQFPRGLPEVIYDKLHGRTKEDAIRLSYPDEHGKGHEEELRALLAELVEDGDGDGKINDGTEDEQDKTAADLVQSWGRIERASSPVQQRVEAKRFMLKIAASNLSPREKLAAAGLIGRGLAAGAKVLPRIMKAVRGAGSLAGKGVESAGRGVESVGKTMQAYPGEIVRGVAGGAGSTGLAALAANAAGKRLSDIRSGQWLEESPNNPPTQVPYNPPTQVPYLNPPPPQQPLTHKLQSPRTQGPQQPLAKRFSTHGKGNRKSTSRRSSRRRSPAVGGYDRYDPDHYDPENFAPQPPRAPHPDEQIEQVLQGLQQPQYYRRDNGRANPSYVSGLDPNSLPRTRP